MKSLRLRRGVLAALVLTAALGIAGGVAYAKVAGSGGVIDACAGDVTGVLRLDGGDGCRTSEHAIQWNQAGPQGPPGVTHADERFFFRNLRDPSTWMPISTGTSRATATHVLTLELDPGTYVVQSQAIGGNFTGTGTLVCVTGNTTVGFAVAQGSMGNAAGYARQLNLSSQSIFPLPEGGGLELSCWAPPDGDGGQPLLGYADVIATQIDTYTSEVGS
jgi:hypothetical protein